ncbi:MAG TPA: DUF6049 family protein [Acidimicrobiales bacterium]
MATRRGRAGRAARAPLAALAVVALVAGGVLGDATPGAASPASPGSPAGPAVPAAQATTIELLEQQPFHHRGDLAVLRLAIEGAPPDAVLEVERHRAVRSRGAFAETVDDELGSPSRTLDPVPVTSLTPSPQGGVEVAYDMAADAGLDDYGVYPLRLLVVSADGTTLAELVTYLVVLPDEGNGFPPLSVAFVMEIGGNHGLRPDGTVLVDAETRAAVEARVEVLRRSRLPLTVAPSPETLDALGAPDADEQSTDLLDRLHVALGGRTPLARPYVDLDLDALAAANLVTQVPSQADSGAQVIRTRFGTEPQGGIWLSGPSLGGGGVDALRQIQAPYVVLPPSAVAEVEGYDAEEIPTEPIEVREGGPTGFVADEVLAERLTGTDGALTAQRFLAELALVWLSRPSVERGVLVRLPELAPIDVDTVSTALAGLGVSGVSRVVTAKELFDTVPPGDDDEGLPEVELAASGDHDDLRPLVEPLGRAQALVPGLAQTVSDSLLVSSLQRSLLVALGADTPQGQRRAYIDRVDVAAADVAAKVSAPEEFQITLTAREGTIPLTITNDTGGPVSVRVHLDSNQLEFPGGTVRDEELPPGPTRLDLDVRTRASGAFPLDITITSPDEAIELDHTTFTIRSTAVSGVGVFLSVGAGLFLLVWWARHWRTAKRSQRLVGQPGA